MVKKRVSCMGLRVCLMVGFLAVSACSHSEPGIVETEAQTETQTVSTSYSFAEDKKDIATPESEQPKTTPLISPRGHQAIRAKIIDATPANYTIDVRSLSNLGANVDAPTFALYMGSRVPDECGDFSALPLAYEVPEKYKRRFDLSNHPEVLQAIIRYRCVIVSNKPPLTAEP